MNLQCELELVASCDLCGHDLFEELFESNGWRIVRCQRCQLAMTSPRPTASAMAEFYSDKFYDEHHSYGQAQLKPPKPEDRAFAREMKALAEVRTRRSNPRSLDVGCGYGRLVQAFADGGFDAMGIEPNRSACTAAQSAGRNVRFGTLDSSDLEVDSFAAITAFHVLEHVHYPGDFLTRCRELLVADGTLAIEVPDFDCPASRRHGPDWSHLHAGEHLHQFTRQTLTAFLRKAGFHVLRVRRVGGRGFLHSQSANVADIRVHRRDFRQRLFDLRRWVYWMPGAQDFARWATWELLGYGDAIRVIARRLPD